MLEKPAIEDKHIIACLQGAYGLLPTHIAFLPLGADPTTAVYRAVVDDQTSYFVKLRRGLFNETSVTLPRYLSDQGIGHIIAPQTTNTGQLWANLDAFTVIVYPFVEGHNGYEVDLSDRHWRDFGAALQRIHTTELPPALAGCLQHETYSAQWRERVKMFLAHLEKYAHGDPVAVKLTTFLEGKRDLVLDLVDRADQLAQVLQARPPEHILCHSDLHAGNILIDVSGNFYIVDWDNPILAPKERDLMFVGSGLGFSGHTLQEEEALFYQGYGQTQIDPVALAYYRYERIIQDIALFCEQLFLTHEGGEDREQAFRYLASNFLPGSVLEIAYTSDMTRYSKAQSG